MLAKILKNKPPCYHNYQGFTLLESLFVVIIIGILSCFIYSSYQTHLIHIRRLEAEMSLIALATRMEQDFSIYLDYLHTEWDPSLSSQGGYMLTIERSSDKFKLRAVPNETQALLDKACQTLVLSSDGRKTIEKGPFFEPNSSVEYCWEL